MKDGYGRMTSPAVGPAWLTRLEGVITALITPCDASGRPDLGAIGELIEFQVASGVTGLFVLGTAGGGPLFDRDERSSLARHLLRTAGDRVGVVVHVGAMPTATAARLAAEAADTGAAVLAAIPPTYYAVDRSAVAAYYEEIGAAAPGVPLLAYDNRASTGYDLRPDEAIELHRRGLIAGVKHASPSIADLAALVAAGVPVWVANAALNLAAWSVGAVGSISTLTNVAPEPFVALADAMSDGDLPRARSCQWQVDTLAAAVRSPAIGGLHAGAALRGLPAGVPRRPLRMPDGEELQHIRAALDAVGVKPARPGATARWDTHGLAR